MSEYFKKINIALVISLMALIASIFHLYTGNIGFLEPREQRSLHLFFLLPMVFLMKPSFFSNSERRESAKPGFLDYSFAVLIAVPALYSYFEAFRINMRLEDVDDILQVELILGGIMTVLILEAIRRGVSVVMFFLVVIGLSYLFLTEYMSGIFYFRDIPYPEIIESLYLYNGNGIFGSITGISATLIAVFLIFGSFIEGSGTGRLFINLGKKVAGRYTGGPAKIAVLTSALFGSMSGSSSSNVFTTGSFTIPMMKKRGYKASFAGGVETAASVGGQSAPPIMGAGAFIMAEITGVPYTDIIIAAVIGSVCYFSMIFITVHLEARKLNLKGIEKSELPSWKEILNDIHLLIPIVVLITLLLMRFSPTYAALISILSTFVASWLRKHTRIGIRKTIDILVTAGKNAVLVAIACVGANMMVLVLTKTGLIVSIGTIVTGVVGDNLFLAGLLLALMTLVLGMGVPTTPAYIVVAAVGVPTLVTNFDVPLLAAHFFVFYFAILADATPPVSIAAYGAAAISGADPIVTAFQATRLAIAGYVVGFSYLFVPELLMEGTVVSILANTANIILGLTIFSIAITGYFVTTVKIPLRIILFPIGLYLALSVETPVEYRLIASIAILVLLYVTSPKESAKLAV